MSNTAPAGATVADNGVLQAQASANGVTFAAGSTPAERFAAIAKSIELGTFAAKNSGGAPPLEFQTPATQSRQAQVEKAAAPTIGGKAAPPSPQQLEQQNSGKLEAFDAEMRAKGLQSQPRDPSGKFAAVPPDQVDQNGVAALSKAYINKMADLERLPHSQARDRTVAEIRKQYEEELNEFYQGRKLGERRSDFHARRDGAAQPAQVTPEAAADIATKASSEDGWAPASAITGPLLHGYTIPQDREYHVAELTAGLRLARAGNLSQAQVEAIIRSQK